MTTKFSYTIYDPCDGDRWPSHDNVPLDADDLDAAEAEVVSEIEAQDLYASDGYAVGAVLQAHIWDADGRVARTVRHQITRLGDR